MPCIAHEFIRANISRPGGSPKRIQPSSVVTDLARTLFAADEDIVMQQALQTVNDRVSDLHTHEGWTFYVILEGAGYLRADCGFKGMFDNQRLSQWTIGSIPPNEPHRFEADSGTEMLVCIFYLGNGIDNQKIARRIKRKPPESQ